MLFNFFNQRIGAGVVELKARHKPEGDVAHIPSGEGPQGWMNHLSPGPIPNAVRVFLRGKEELAHGLLKPFPEQSP
jgi:hypothetical protein